MPIAATKGREFNGRHVKASKSKTKQSVAGIAFQNLKCGECKTAMVKSARMWRGEVGES